MVTGPATVANATFYTPSEAPADFLYGRTVGQTLPNECNLGAAENGLVWDPAKFLFRTMDSTSLRCWQRGPACALERSGSLLQPASTTNSTPSFCTADFQTGSADGSGHQSAPLKAGCTTVNGARFQRVYSDSSSGVQPEPFMQGLNDTVDGEYF